ncbi:MAG: diguanylate cyclase [Campylobacterota bacterium]|nr:diguanylate cyclase [Campylobacterota bacterium]
MYNHEKIKWKYLSIFFVLFGIILLGRISYDTKHHENMLERIIDDLTLNIEKEFYALQDGVKNKYLMIAHQYMQNENIYKLFEHAKRDKLYSSLLNDYKLYKKFDSHLHVMHFFDTKNITVLRMHKPNSFNDDLTTKRPMVAYTNRLLNTLSSFDVGKNGVLYRVSVPYIYQKKHLGILEFGIKPSYFVDHLTQQFDIKSKILVQTNSLKTLTSKKDYKHIEDYSIVSSSEFFNQLSTKLDLNKNRQIVSVDDKTYIILTNLNFTDFQNKIVAKLIISKDITKFIKKNEDSLLMANTLTFVIITFILIILFVIFTKYSRELDFLNKKSIHLKNKANLDALTKIHNKAYFNQSIDIFLSSDKPACIIFFDIDHFKKINDTYGHLSGDEILISLASEINKFLRNDDVFVRWGGEEFIILLENIPLNKAIKKAQELRILVESTKFVQNIPVTISLGVTQLQNEDSKEILLKRVDDLLYKAKGNGRNCVEHDS